MSRARVIANFGDNSVISVYNSNVGIGSTLPTGKLDVSGSAKITGVVTATSFVGNVTGNATGLSGSPNITAGVVTATSYFGDGSTLTGVGVSATANVNTTGIITASTVVATADLDIPSGTSAQRPVAGITTGSFRYNTFYNSIEIWTGTEWGLVASVLPSVDNRGVFGGGVAPAATNTIDYITIASIGNAIDFGDLTVARYNLAACSSSTRGIFGGGNVTPAATNTIDYITIASTGNAIDFGDLTIARSDLVACSSITRGVFGGGLTPTSQNTIDYITIATTGNAIDFGDLTVARSDLAACSGGHGGIS